MSIFKVLVVCPPHLVEKWPREIAAVVPFARGVRTTVLERLGDLVAFRADADRAAATDDDEIRFAVVSSEILKLGSGWTGAAVRSRRQSVRRLRVEDGKETVEYVPVLLCPRCGARVEREAADGDKTDLVPVLDPDVLSAERMKCLACREPLYQAWRGYRPKLERDPYGDLVPPRPARWPMSTYIRRKMRGWFDLAIVDEVHEAKGQSTDRGHAVGEVISAAKRTLALTGTLFGGTASSVFYLLQRLSADVRGEYRWSDVQRFVTRFGIEETVTYGKPRDRDEGYGRFSGLRRSKIAVRERPGVSPELVRLLLSRTAFVSLDDLGYRLPAYNEYPVLLDMTKEMASEYDRIESSLREDARANPKRLGEYLQTTLGWPNAPWREITIDGLGTVDPIHVDERTPKESWLVETVRSEVEAGRKCLVFCRQTGTKDIQPRLQSLLEAAGVHAVTLSSSVPPAKREAWVAKRVGEIDALIVQPRCVQTGLDLVAFATTIFYEPDYSLYVVQQAARRTWRLGQTLPVKVFYPTYAGTMEHRALGIIGKKLVAAQLLYGDDVSAAFAADQGGSLLEELAKEAAASSKIPDLRDLFVASDADAEPDLAAEMPEAEIPPGFHPPVGAMPTVQLSLFV